MSAIPAVLRNGGSCFFHQHGVLVATISSSPMNHSFKVAEAVTFFTNGQGGIELLRAFHGWAETLGADRTVLNQLPADLERKKRVLARFGYDIGAVSFVRSARNGLMETRPASIRQSS